MRCPCTPSLVVLASFLVSVFCIIGDSSLFCYYYYYSVGVGGYCYCACAFARGSLLLIKAGPLSLSPANPIIGKSEQNPSRSISSVKGNAAQVET